MHRGWLLFALSALLAAGGVVAGVVGLSEPPLLLLAVVLAGGSYACWSRARARIVADVYARVGVEPNSDGTVGDEGARATRTRTGRVSHEPRDDWDDPDDWPFDDPFWTAETDGGTRGARAGPGGAAPGAASTDGADADGDASDPAGGASRSADGVRFVAPRERDACDVLGVTLDATAEQVRAAYRERVKEAHPDRGGSEAAFKRVRWAYEYLRSRRECGRDDGSE